MIKIKIHHIFNWDVNNLYGWAMSENVEWLKDTSQFDEVFMKNYKEESDEGYFLGADVQYLQILHKLYNDLPFLPEGMKIETSKSL